jgi:hypothetical protein
MIASANDEFVDFKLLYFCRRCSKLKKNNFFRKEKTNFVYCIRFLPEAGPACQPFLLNL